MACNEKRCSKCGATKPLSEFYRSAKTKDGHQNYCKACQLQYWKEYNERTGYVHSYYDRNKKRILEQQHEYNKTPAGICRKIRYYKRKQRSALQTSTASS